MVDRDVFSRRLARLEELVRDLRGLAKAPLDSFLGDRGLQAQAERWMQLAAECALDLAYHLIASRGWPAPTTYREAFEELGRQGVVTPELASRLAAWAGLRNILVHLYLEVDHRQLHRILVEDLGELEAFAAAIARVD